MSYQHTGNAWTDIVTAESRHIYCDDCSEEARRPIRERMEDDIEAGGTRAMMALCGLHKGHTLVGYFTPDYDDICDGCGVVAANQHQEQT